MRATRLVLRGLLYRWRTNLAVALGAALATAVLIGALGAGDSVRHSLRRIALNRLGRTGFALEAGDRFLRAELASELATRLGGRGAALIALNGAASARGGEGYAAGVRVLGVDANFWQLSPERIPAGPSADEVLLNEALARRLHVEPGEEVLLRVQSSPLMPGEAPLSVGAGDTAALRLTVKAVLPESGFGNFSLRVGQAPPLNAFVPRELLAARIGRPGRTNTLLLSTAPGRTLPEVEQALTEAWRLEDAGLSFRRTGEPETWELVSDRVFIDPPVEEAARAEGGQGVLTYFVDRIGAGRRSLHYSFVAAAASRTPEYLGDGEILLNTWAARELGAAPGDEVELEYLVPGPAPGGPLSKQAARFRVGGIVPIRPEDRTLLPDFPGLAGVKNCRDWDPGMPIDVSLLTDRDQAYWELYGGSPKAFVSLAAAQRMWANRFGRLTAVRFDTGQTGGASQPSRLASSVLGRLQPSDLGLAFLPVRDIGLKASSHGVDFGQLFLGLSFFLIAAALLLTGLLFLLSVEQRAADSGLFAALGFTRGRMLRLLAAEGALVAVAGSAVGLLLGLLYHRGLLAGLQTIWQDAVRTPSLLPYIAPGSLLTGFAGGLGSSLLVLTLSTLRLLRTSPARALRGLPAAPPALSARPRLRRPPLAGLAAGACLLGAGAVLLVLSPPASFFTAGALLLAACLAAVSWWLKRLGRPRSAGSPSIAGLGLQNSARRRARSLAVASLAACGIFIVTAVAANRLGVPDPDRRDSGTGGFALWSETSAPVPVAEARLPAAAGLEPGGFVGFRVLEGDDASCLNLNRAAQPRILGVEPARLRGRFTFTSFAGGRKAPDPWSLLEADLGPNTVPAVADQSVITWGLGLQVGEELEYRDERGRALKVRLVAGLANSVFQGSLIVSESALVRHFPSTAGYRLYLVEASADRRTEQGRSLARTLSRYGVSVTPAAERLAEFNSVENAYLAIFAVLGWLGLLLGTLGLAIVVVRNVTESRRELALLRAVGLGRPALVRLVLAEHLLPLGLGLAGGLLASALAVYPAASRQGTGLPFGSLLIPLFAIVASAALWIVASAGFALRADLLPALRNE